MGLCLELLQGIPYQEILLMGMGEDSIVEVLMTMYSQVILFKTIVFTASLFVDSVTETAFIITISMMQI